MIIRNNESLAEEIARKIKEEGSGFELKLIAGKSCVSVEEDKVFDQTYYEGKSYASDLKEHVGKAQSYIEQISETLKEADRLSAQGILRGITQVVLTNTK